LPNADARSGRLPFVLGHGESISRILGPSQARADLVAHAAYRWAQAVAGILDCPFDPRTVALWGRAIGVSEGTLRDWCRVAQCRPKSSLDLARLLRAVVQSQDQSWDPFNLLDVVNERTLKNLLRRGGLTDLLSSSSPPTPRGLLLQQRFVTNGRAVELLAMSIERGTRTS
jgi:hypothetical protein